MDNNTKIENVSGGTFDTGTPHKITISSSDRDGIERNYSNLYILPMTTKMKYRVEVS